MVIGAPIATPIQLGKYGSDCQIQDECFRDVTGMALSYLVSSKKLEMLASQEICSFDSLAVATG